jgi:hypothetical protein
MPKTTEGRSDEGTTVAPAIACGRCQQCVVFSQKNKKRPIALCFCLKIRHEYHKAIHVYSFFVPKTQS